MTQYTIEPLVVGALGTNCWLYPLQEGPSAGKTRPCAVIDPGADPEFIIAQMENLNLYPRYLLLTHGHFDHLLALPALFARYGAGETAPLIALHGDDAACLGPEADRVHRETLAAAAGNAAYAGSPGLGKALPPPGKLLAEGDRIGPFTVLHLPGHSPGSAGFYDPAAGVLFSGDTLFRNGVGRTDLPGGDSRKLGASLQRLFSLDKNTAVCPGHGPATTIGEERDG